MGAAFKESIDVVETLIAFDADIEAVNERLETALMLTVVYGRDDSVKLLLALNADTTKTDCDGKTISQCAQRRDEIQQLFLDHEKKLVSRCIFVLR